MQRYTVPLCAEVLLFQFQLFAGPLSYTRALLI